MLGVVADNGGGVFWLRRRFVHENVNVGCSFVYSVAPAPAQHEPRQFNVVKYCRLSPGAIGRISISFLSWLSLQNRGSGYAELVYVVVPLLGGGGAVVL